MVEFIWSVYGNDYKEVFYEYNYYLAERDGKEDDIVDVINYEGDIRDNDYYSENSFSLSDYLVDIFYVNEFSKLIELNGEFSDTDQRITNLDQACKSLNSVIWGTKGYIDYLYELVRPAENNQNKEFEALITGYLGELYKCLMANHINYESEENRRSYLTDIQRYAGDESFYKGMDFGIIERIENLYTECREYVSLDSDEYKRRRNKLLYVIRLLPEEIGGVYKERKELYKEKRHQIMWHVPTEGILLASMIIDTDTFEQYTLRIIDQVKSDTEKYVKNLCIEDYKYNDDFKKDAEKIKEEIKRGAGFQRKYVKRKGCFGIMHVYPSGSSGVNKYLAFSGQEDCNDTGIQKYFKLNTDRCRNLFAAMSRLVTNIFPSFTWARTTYDIKYYSMVNGNLMIETLWQYKKRVPVIAQDDLNDTKRRFSCCERKMLEPVCNNSVMGIDKYQLFTRFETCPICDLALNNFNKTHSIPPDKAEIYYSKTDTEKM